MNTPADHHSKQNPSLDSIQRDIGRIIDDLLASLPAPEGLTAGQRRSIIARYTAVLEGNFIYWMTAAYLSVKSEEARAIILENLHEEVRDCHPGMLRRFAMAAHAAPTEAEALAVYSDLSNVRLFMGRLSAVPVVVTMAFFEGFIQRFMAFLAQLAKLQGSAEMEYTDVHGVCDVTHTQELYRALEIEMEMNEPAKYPMEGVHLLRKLIDAIVMREAVARPASDRSFVGAA